jgi:hypothetical protein
MSTASIGFASALVEASDRWPDRVEALNNVVRVNAVPTIAGLGVLAATGNPAISSAVTAGLKVQGFTYQINLANRLQENAQKVYEKAQGYRAKSRKAKTGKKRAKFAELAFSNRIKASELMQRSFHAASFTADEVRRERLYREDVEDVKRRSNETLGPGDISERLRAERTRERPTR